MLTQNPDTLLYSIESNKLAVSTLADGSLAPRVGGQGIPYFAECRIEYTGAETADDPIFAMRNRASGGNGYTGYLKRIEIEFNRLSAALADRGIGFYWQRFSGAAHAGGTAVVAVAPQGGTTDMTDIRAGLDGTALTAVGVSYTTGTFAHCSVGFSVEAAYPYRYVYQPVAPNGIPFAPGVGLVMRLGGAAALVGGAATIVEVGVRVDWLEGPAAS